MLRIAAGQAARPSEEYLRFAAQLGLTSVQFNTPDLPGNKRWEVADLVALRERCESFGLRLEAIENIPVEFYLNSMLGRPGRDEEIEHVRATIANIASAEIPVLGYCFMPQSVWRTSLTPTGRGGAVVSGFDANVAADPARRDEVLVARRDLRVEDAKDSWTAGSHIVSDLRISEEEMWDNYAYFMAGIIPAAEEAGIRLALHPDDPPVPELDGVGRLFRSVDALRRASKIASSPAWGLELCLGTVSEMGGEAAVFEAIDFFGPRNEIVYVHLRDVRGYGDSFVECFLGEGNYDPVRVIERLIGVGFDGFLLDDHTPLLVNDSPYGHRGRAHAIGYMQGIIDALSRGGSEDAVAHGTERRGDASTAVSPASATGAS